jgi:hypothetical protein
MMVAMALLRIKRPEGLKEHVPGDLGRALGLDRAPEVKTLRRKLRKIAGMRRADQFGRALARVCVNRDGDAVGFLYVDGHVRVYHGKEELPKAHVAQQKTPMPATTDYWVNDARGDPLLVITAKANATLTQALPDLLAQVRTLVGKRRVTVVFDRGGWSPELFATLISAGFDILTYRKGRYADQPVESFTKRTQMIDGRTVSYLLADSEVPFAIDDGILTLRQVTRLCDNGHQTAIVTSRRDLTAAEVANRMFARWQQENFFKYLLEEYALDALVDYTTEADDPQRMVPNPVWKELDAQMKKARAELDALKARYGHAAAWNVESVRRTMRGFKIANAETGRALEQALLKYASLRSQRDMVPRRVPVQQVIVGEVVKLATEAKLITSIIKMVAYRVESDLTRMVAPHYARAEDEGRTLIATAFRSAADITVTGGELRVSLAPQSSPHRTRAIAALCDELNKHPVRFPGTNLTLRYSIRIDQPQA